MTDQTEAKNSIDAIRAQYDELEETKDVMRAAPDLGVEMLSRWEDRTAGVIEANIGATEAQKFLDTQSASRAGDPRGNLGRKVRAKKAFLTALVDELRQHPDAVFARQPRTLPIRESDYISAEPSYQVQQSIMAVGAGGWFGDGLGAGRAKLFYLPEAQSDFIFAIFAEELGFVGALGLVLLYAALLVAGWRIARRCTDPFGRTLTFAIVASITIGALINIAVAIGALPAKGIPLPFVSYGGSSLVVSMAAVGILMNVAERSPTTTDETADQRRRDGRAPDAGDRAGAGLAPAKS